MTASRLPACVDCHVWLGWSARSNRCQQCREAKRGDDRDFYTRTSHCGACGQPGNYCFCTVPCGCHELHECGSGRAADPTEVFADTPVIDGQETLL